MRLRTRLLDDKRGKANDIEAVIGWLKAASNLFTQITILEATNNSLLQDMERQCRIRKPVERALRVIDRKREELQKAEQDQSQLFQESLLLARKLATAQARIARLRQELDAASSKTKAAFEEEEASIEEQENFEKEIGISLSEVGDLESFDFEAFLNNDVASLNA
ncbi:hypothetical protein Dda_6077 [Drechslerella dactyloides]|uniref:Uncharacterized protein n=1 Tax=Drechslerella dactyloides TaxID=74499 RepID=A0AAD6NI49_DREDA|nr:hypothetical protein Dda_6077 [Drechslerella dactyloides]